MFDLLRAKVEAEVPHPAVLAITSATDDDGLDIAAHALATSLSATGYSTLLIDARSEADFLPHTDEVVSLDEVGRRAVADAESTSSKLTIVTIGEPVQRGGNHRNINAAFELFREKFDYVIISTGSRGSSNAFTATVLGAANATLVSVKIGRRQTRDDARLAADLESLGTRFLGLIPMTQSTTDTAPATRFVTPSEPTEAWRAPMSATAKTNARRAIAERTNYTIRRMATTLSVAVKVSRWQRILGIISVVKQRRTEMPVATQTSMPPDTAKAWRTPVPLPVIKNTERREIAGWSKYAFFGGSAGVAFLAWLLVEVSSK